MQLFFEIITKVLDWYLVFLPQNIPPSPLQGVRGVHGLHGAHSSLFCNSFELSQRFEARRRDSNKIFYVNVVWLKWARELKVVGRGHPKMCSKVIWHHGCGVIV